MKEETNIHSQIQINKGWNEVISSQTKIHKTWDEVAGRWTWTYSHVFTFHSKADYLDFRRCWKENYAALSQSIRTMKAHVKATMRRREYAGKEQAELLVRAEEATVQLLLLKCAKADASRAAREMADSRKRGA